MKNELHESAEDLRPETRDMHRALASLIEELEAVDWYGQRVEACDDATLREVLAHNRDEEKEHACMTLEWIRRKDPTFDRHLRAFLFQPAEESIVGHGPDDHDRGAPEPTLGIASLRSRTASSSSRESRP